MMKKGYKNIVVGPHRFLVTLKKNGMAKNIWLDQFGKKFVFDKRYLIDVCLYKVTIVL